ncbi:hypothetical protein SAMN06265376_106201 [Dokdonia pacifica]|uniref:Uncharacterized protein n=1 Tax=Dokdonia pacifica TaxID=1627892 RepID=A0A239BJA6_9FLAO|nr:hypothetical protein SAMN06265376_106201 [Dokdonia pacifica]
MRLAGQMLQQTDLSTNIGSNQHVLPDQEKPTLSQLGLTKNESITYGIISHLITFAISRIRLLPYLHHKVNNPNRKYSISLIKRICLYRYRKTCIG